MKSGQLLRELRQEANVSQYELADKLGMTAAALSRKESGKRPITVSEWQRAFEILKVVDPNVKAQVFQ